MMNPDSRTLRPLARAPRLRKAAGALLAAMLTVAASGAAWAHGDVTPQAVDTSSLPK